MDPGCDEGLRLKSVMGVTSLTVYRGEEVLVAGQAEAETRGSGDSAVVAAGDGGEREEEVDRSAVGAADSEWLLLWGDC